MVHKMNITIGTTEDDTCLVREDVNDIDGYNRIVDGIKAYADENFGGMDGCVEFDYRFFDGENLDVEKASKESFANLFKFGMQGDLRVHHKTAECPRCRRFTPECYFDNKYYKQTNSWCDRCNITKEQTK